MRRRVRLCAEWRRCECGGCCCWRPAVIVVQLLGHWRTRRTPSEAAPDTEAILDLDPFERQAAACKCVWLLLLAAALAGVHLVQ